MDKVAIAYSDNDHLMPVILKILNGGAIANADQVVVLKQGRIVEQGTYQALLGQQGQLWQYHQMQYNQPTQV